MHNSPLRLVGICRSGSAGMLSVSMSLVAAGVIFSSPSLAACPYNYLNHLEGTGQTLTISSPVVVSVSGQKAIVDCGTGSVINVMSSGSVLAEQSGGSAAFLVPSLHPAGGDPTGTLNNEGSIQSYIPVLVETAFGVINNGSALGSSASINGTSPNGDSAVVVGSGGGLDRLRNYGVITSKSVLATVYAQRSTINNIENYGSITGNALPGFGSSAIGVFGGTGTGLIEQIDNWGTISGDGASTASGINVRVGGSITTINNRGSVIGSNGAFGIYNNGSITTLNNQQGVGNTNGPLTYRGTLPASYNLFINSFSSYGQLAVANPSGNTTFGIVAGSTVNPNGRYAAVLSGLDVSGSYLVNTSVPYAGMTGTLVSETGSSTIWDLCFGLCNVSNDGPAAADTQTSLQALATGLHGIYRLQAANITAGLQFDCSVFDKQGLCVSVRGGSVNVGSAGAAPVTMSAAYRLNHFARIGFFVGQDLNINDTPNVRVSRSSPLVGAFAALQETTTGLGWNARASLSYVSDNLLINRTVFGTSEPGRGASTLSSKAAQVDLWHGYAVTPALVASPYMGLRYVTTTRQAYTENGSADVLAPLSYDRLTQAQMTALAGVKGVAALSTKLNLTWALGAEYDLHNQGGNFSAAGVNGIESFSFNPATNRTRPSGQVGFTYATALNQQVGVNLSYRKDAFTKANTFGSFVSYSLGF